MTEKKRTSKSRESKQATTGKNESDSSDNDIADINQVISEATTAKEIAEKARREAETIRGNAIVANEEAVRAKREAEKAMKEAEDEKKLAIKAKEEAAIAMKEIESMKRKLTEMTELSKSQMAEEAKVKAANSNEYEFHSLFGSADKSNSSTPTDKMEGLNLSQKLLFSTDSTSVWKKSIRALIETVESDEREIDKVIETCKTLRDVEKYVSAKESLVKTGKRKAGAIDKGGASAAKVTAFPQPTATNCAISSVHPISVPASNQPINVKSVEHT
jgi:hypothetical protein